MVHNRRVSVNECPHDAVLVLHPHAIYVLVRILLLPLDDPVHAEVIIDGLIDSGCSLLLMTLVVLRLCTMSLDCLLRRRLRVGNLVQS